MADPGKVLWGPGNLPLFLDQNEAQRAENFFWRLDPAVISRGLAVQWGGGGGGGGGPRIFIPGSG